MAVVMPASEAEQPKQRAVMTATAIPLIRCRDITHLTFLCVCSTRQTAGRDECAGREKGERPTMHRGPQLPARRPGTVIESSMRTVIAGQRFPEVVRPVRFSRFLGLLPVVADLRQISIEQTGSQDRKSTRLNSSHS